MLMSSGSVLGYFLQVLPIAVLAGAIYLAVRLAALKKRGARAELLPELLRVIFVCYLSGLISLIVLPANFWLYVYDGIFLGWWDELGPIFRLGEIDLVPSALLWARGELSLGSWVKTMLIGNVAMFVPLGLLLPLVSKINSPKKMLAAAAAIPLCLETAQLFCGRSFDADDLICNFIGIAVGAIAAFAILRYGKRQRSHIFAHKSF